MQRLRDLDYPVQSVPGVAGGYRLGAGAVLPPLLLDDDEAIAVVVGLRAAATHMVAGLPEASVRALAKLDQVLPARLRQRTASFAQATVALPGPGGVIDQALLTMLAGACRGHQRLRFGYRDHGGAVSARDVEPHRLVSAGYRWYLMAFDTERGDWRTFRVDRISDATAGGRFAPRDAPDPGSFVAAAVTTAPYRYQARILVHAPLRDVTERVTPTSGMLADAGGGRCLLTTGADSLAAMMFHFADLGAEFTVLEPPELIEYLRDVGAAAAGGGRRPVLTVSPDLSPDRRARGRASAWPRPR